MPWAEKTLVKVILGSWFFPVKAETINASTQFMSQVETGMDDSSQGSYSESWAKSQCRSYGGGWSVKHIDRKWGALFCLKGGTSLGSNCNRCDTYRIVAWKSGAGDQRGCGHQIRYNTMAGYIYPSHVSPCACGANTLGGPCFKGKSISNYNSAKAYCDRLGSSWHTAHTDRKWGALFCLKRGTSLGSNCNNCGTYRIVVWKDGGGDQRGCGHQIAYNTKGGSVYPSHVNPCACGANTLGSPCDSFGYVAHTTITTTTTTTTTTKLYQLKIVTWVMPETISWKVMRGKKMMCKGSQYGQWYTTIDTGCMLPKGSYTLICMDEKGHGFKGGHMHIAGHKKKYCHAKYMWNHGKKRKENFNAP